MKVSTITLGCKVNQYETQAMLESIASGWFSHAKQAKMLILFY